jgi:Zn-dependent peptidase ImmA (M78 family)
MNKENFKLKILGVEHDVKFKKKVEEKDDELFGTYEQFSREILISKKIDAPFQLAYTIIHELLHGIEQGLSLTCFESKKGHNDLDRLAYGITRFIYENDKEILKKLFTLEVI